MLDSIVMKKEVEMNEKFIRYGDTVVLTIVLWSCSLPFVGLAIFLLFGQKITFYTTAGLLILFLPICCGICGWRIFKERSG